MAPAQVSLPDGCLDDLRQLEKAERVGDGGPILPDPLRDDLLCVLNGNFDGIEMLSLEVLNEGELQHLLVGRDMDDVGRDLLEPSFPGSAHSAFSRDELVPPCETPHSDGLNEPLLPNRLRQLIECFSIEIRPGLVGISLDP